MNPGSTSLSARDESANLDFLRSIAVLSVYAFHVLYTVGVSHIDRATPDWGWCLGRFGVLVFFVHTSLVLMMSLERTEELQQPLFRSFYIRRFFRIYPLSMACVALVVLFHLPQSPLVPWWGPDWSTIAANFFLCTNVLYKGNIISVLWSLPLEVQMYVMLPFIYLIGKKFKLPGIALLWLAGIAAAYIQPHVAERLTIAPYVPCFLAGVACYFLGFGNPRMRRLPFFGWALMIALAAGIFLAFGPGPHSEVAWLICLLLGLSAPFFKDLQWPALKKVSALIARYSYGIYLTHMYALWAGLVVLKGHSWWLRIGVVAVLSAAVPVVFYHFLEAPLMKFGGRLAKRLPKRVASGSSVDGETARAEMPALREHAIPTVAMEALPSDTEMPAPSDL